MPSSLRSGDPIAKDDALFSEPLALTSTSQTTSNSSAIDVDENSHLSLWQAIKKWHRVFWYSLAISSTIIMFGYDFVIVGNSSAMPAFQHDFGTEFHGEWIIPSLWLGLWTFISPGGMMFGSFFAGHFQDCTQTISYTVAAPFSPAKVSRALLSA
ncbi:hypothetical protein NQ176_g8377 [Zarea fungicola]|uniref:Uncharacterized protein n=1 Tax=Zarea fungicola TaxID=93591 RepID=A0ACC1MT78_9HYPO|nr:hypothetical protein NQ176_g8377 [Lecanicillium fungicola]